MFGNRLMISKYPNGKYRVFWRHGALWCDDEAQAWEEAKNIIALYFAANKYRFVV